MKQTLTLLVALLISVLSFAQQGINYKALIKDDLGNVVAGGTINVRFTIIDDSVPTDVYQETHFNTTTDANGIVILAIGTGTPDLNLFTDVDWSNSNSLKVEIDLEQDGTYVDFGETSFKKVPMAIHADNVFSGDYNDLSNIPSITSATGLEYLDETDDTIDNGGLAIIGRDSNNYGPIGENAIDLSYSEFDTTPPRGATGPNSFASGFLTNASGFYSTAMGFSTNAYGNASTTMGVNLETSAYASTAIGELNIDESNALFMIGNGYVDGNNLIQSNALVAYRDGIILAPSFDLNEIIDDKALITKEYADSNLVSSGLEYIDETDDDEDNGGWRFKEVNPGFYGSIGNNAVDLSIQTFISSKGATGDYSNALGRNTEASGDYSTAMGERSIASGSYSIAAGNFTKAIGDSSTAMGENSEALGTYSIAIGNSTEASGEASVALGYNTIASAPNSVAIGLNTNATGIRSTAMGSFTAASAMNSTAFGSSTTASGDHSTSMGIHTTAFSIGSTAIGKYSQVVSGLFIVGNGNSTSDRNNALVIKNNGDAQFDGEVQTTATGTANMIPIAYGSVSSTGSILGGSGNFTVTYNASDTSYTIFVNNEPVTASNSAGIVTVNTSTFRTANTTYDGVNMLVHIFLISGNKVQSPFQFVIHKN